MAIEPRLNIIAVSVKKLHFRFVVLPGQAPRRVVSALLATNPNYFLSRTYGCWPLMFIDCVVYIDYNEATLACALVVVVLRRLRCQANIGYIIGS